jgi:hypothetical protein
MERELEHGFLPSPEPINGFETPLPYVILGDEGFGLKPWLMRPFPGSNLPPKEAVFNFRLSRARKVVENAFGILAARWRIFHTPIDCDTDLVNLIIMTSVILHNFLGVQNDTTGCEDETPKEVFPDVSTKGGRNHSKNSKQVRQLFCEYFLSTPGSLTGQLAWVMRGHQ